MYSAERQFVTTAHSQLCLLEQDGHHTQKTFEAAIGEIKNASRPVKARAIYRGALLCEDVLRRCNATSIKFRTSLSGLKSLVELYANGLYEIDPSFKSVLLGNTAPDAPKISLETIGGRTTGKEHPRKDTLKQLKAANENAAKVLKPLLHMVKDDKQARALSFLAGIDHQSARKISAPRINTRANVRFDVLMRRITNHTLGEARALAKNVSISYAADFETVDTSVAPELQTFLQTACLEIVRCGLVVNGDLAASVNRTWQISITGETRTGETQGQNLLISLNWRGEQLLGFGSTGKSKQLLQSLNGRLTAHSEQTTVDDKLNMHTLEFICPVKKSELSHIDIQQLQVREA